MRPLYTLAWYALLPFAAGRLWWRGRKEPGYRQHVGERFGRFAPAPSGPVIWLHAVSLGETRAAGPLVHRLLEAYPACTVLLTHMTATGRAAGAELVSPRVVQAWLPYDLPLLARRFLTHYRPAAGLLMETEVWPNLVQAAHAAKLPVFLVNARLSVRSAAGYRRAGKVARETFASLTGVAAQSADDAARLAALGAPMPVVTGNLKFDVEIPPAAHALARTLRTRFDPARPVLLAASTREGEEALILDALARRPLPEGTLLVLVPRHPQRFDAVAELLHARNIAFVRRSADTPVPPAARVMLGDSLGEMAAYCAAADVVFVGGSLLPLGGQNLIEPIAAGRPTLVGPHTFNFAQITDNAVEAGAARRVDTADAMLATASALLQDEAAQRAMQRAALAFHARHAGAGARLWAWLAPQLDTALAASARRAVSPSGDG